jgi:hypothetical protein
MLQLAPTPEVLGITVQFSLALQFKYLLITQTVT